MPPDPNPPAPPEIKLLVTQEKLEPGLASNVVIITDNELANQLLQNQTETLALLSSEIAQLSISDIRIDDVGRIVVQNQAFVDAVKTKLPLELGGIICANGGCRAQ